MLQLILLDLIIIHLMLAPLASVVSASHNRFATYHTGWEIAAAGTANGVVLTDCVFAVFAWTFDLLAWAVFWGMLGEDADCDVHVSLSLFLGTHSLKLHKSSRTLFIALH